MGPPTHYDILGVLPGCSLDEIRLAYRRRARELHPDVSSARDAGAAMARVNESWRILSDPRSRHAYDATLVVPTSRHPGPGAWHAPPTPQPPPQAGRSRRVAWLTGVQAQIARLSRLAGRSAAQAMLVRSTRAPRETYERAVESIVADLLHDTEARVRAARAAGAAPLDLGVAATLIGLRSLADRLRRDASLGITAEVQMKAELIDRMWDILAHELTKQLTVALGGNPRISQALAHR